MIEDNYAFKKLFIPGKTKNVGDEIKRILYANAKSNKFDLEEIIYNGGYFFFHFKNSLCFSINLDFKDRSNMYFTDLNNPSFHLLVNIFRSNDVLCGNALFLINNKICIQSDNYGGSTVNNYYLTCETEEKARIYMDFMQYILSLLNYYGILKEFYLRLVKCEDNCIVIDNDTKNDRLSILIKKINNF